MAAAVSCSGTSDSDGHISGSYTASDLTGSVTISVSDGSASATVAQHWSDLGADPTCASDTAEYGVPDALDFKMAFNDSSGSSIPLTGHTIQFVTTSISGWEWSDADQDFEPVNLTSIDQVNADSAAMAAVTYASGSASGGDYPGSLTVNETADFITATVTFWAQDPGTFSSS